MAGVRIHHHSERNRTMLFEHYGRLIKRADGSLTPKRYHLKLDDLGNAIVSETVWNRLKEIGVAHDFIVMNEVRQPPSQRLEIILPPRATVPQSF